jgi:hypothetical protein
MKGMADETSPAKPGRFRLYDVPGTTLAVASLAILGAAALVTAPLWLWYRTKRKKADALARQAAEAATPSEDAAKDPAEAEPPA